MYAVTDTSPAQLPLMSGPGNSGAFSWLPPCLWPAWIFRKISTVVDNPPFLSSFPPPFSSFSPPSLLPSILPSVLPFLLPYLLPSHIHFMFPSIGPSLLPCLFLRCSLCYSLSCSHCCSLASALPFPSLPFPLRWSLCLG